MSITAIKVFLIMLYQTCSGVFLPWVGNLDHCYKGPIPHWTHGVQPYGSTRGFYYMTVCIKNTCIQHVCVLVKVMQISIFSISILLKLVLILDRHITWSGASFFHCLYFVCNVPIYKVYYGCNNRFLKLHIIKNWHWYRTGISHGLAHQMAILWSTYFLRNSKNNLE